MRIRISQHFAERQRLRDIPSDFAEMILRGADGYYRNGITGWFVAVKRIKFQGKERDMALTYAIKDYEIVLITLHLLKEGQKARRVASRRWIPDEPPSLL